MSATYSHPYETPPDDTPYGDMLLLAAVQQHLLSTKEWRYVLETPVLLAQYRKLTSASFYPSVLAYVAQGKSDAAWAKDHQCDRTATRLRVRYERERTPANAAAYEAAQEAFAGACMDATAPIYDTIATDETISTEKALNILLARAKTADRTGDVTGLNRPDNAPTVTVNNVSVDARRQVVISTEDWSRAGLNARRAASTARLTGQTGQNSLAAPISAVPAESLDDLF